MRNIDDYEDKYITEYNFEKILVQYRRRKVLDVMEHYNHKRILEIGCGAEPLFTHIKEDFEEYVVVEPGDVFYSNAEELAKKMMGDKIKCFHGLFESFIDELIKYKFDYIICSCLLHEVEDPSNLIQKILKICKPHTVIHINVPNANSFHRLLAKESNIIDTVYKKSERNISLQQHTIYDMNKLTDTILSFPNTEIIEKGSYFIKPFTHRQMDMCLKENIIDEKILNGFYNMIKYIPNLGAEIYVNFKIKYI